MCYYALGDLRRAENTILKHLNYKQNENLLALVGLIRHVRSSIPEHAYKKLVESWMNVSPKDWEFLDRLYLYGITEKQLTLSKPRKKDSVDNLIEAKVKTSKKKNSSWKFLEIILAKENKDYEKFKQLHSDLFKAGDLDDQVLLALLSITVDSALASESIQKIRSTHGDFPGLSLLEACKCLVARDIETAKSLVERHKVLKEESLIGRTILALYYLKNSEDDKSLAILDELIAENPKATFFRGLRADINYYRQKLSSAKEDYALYTVDHPDDTKVLHRLARLSFIEKENAKGLDYTQKLFAQSVKDDLHFAELLEAILLNKPVSVKNTFLDEEHKSGIQSVFDLLNKNEVDAAKEKLNALISAEPVENLDDQYDSFYYYVLAIINLVENNFFECQWLLFDAYAEYPTEEIKLLLVELSKTDEEHVSEDKLFLAGKDAFQKLVDKNFAGSAEVYETAAEAYPTFCYLWYRAGIYRYLAKDRDRASTDYSKALQCEPEAKDLHLFYADLIKEKDCNLAIQHLSRSLEIDGESVNAFDGLSQCYEKLGDTALAKEYYKKYKKLYFEKGGNPINFFFYQPLRHL